MLVTMKEVLEHANEGNYAVVAPNVTCEWDARCDVEVAEELNSPLILDVGFDANPNLEFFGSYLVNMAKASKVPVAINLDHGKKYAHCIMAIRSGFSSIMVDRSQLSFEDNVREVKELVKIAHSVGVSVEAELGHVGMGSNYAEDGTNALTEPEEALRYVQETGVDCLAVAIGTAHGAYVGTPHLDFERLKEIKETVKMPLVLHGGSGSGDENLRKACSMGINKVNINNDLMKAACEEIRNADTSGDGAYRFWELAAKGRKARLRELMHVFGSVGKAFPVENKGVSSVPFVDETI